MAPSSDDRERAEALAKRVTVGIVTALPEERAAMLAMLDQSVSWSVPGRGAGLVYDLGEIPAHGGGRHVIAVALAGMGNNIAAARGTLLLAHFPGIEAILMVGIAGGIPNPARAGDHVRLGDVVVSDRRGVIQYDFVKRTRRATEVRASPRPPHARLLEAVHILDSDALAGARPWEAYAERASHLLGAARPHPSSDVLLASRKPFSPLEHPADPKRTEGQPRIFMGPIASGNALLKDPVWRDRLRDQHGVKAVEMEASGIADATWVHAVGYLVVRGVCDYCDSNKNDDWHMYAAVVAAAYSRALLGYMGSLGIRTPTAPRDVDRVRHDPDIVLNKVSTIPDDCVGPFVDALADAGVSLKIETREPSVYLSIEWFVPTALVVYITRPYFEGFLREAGKDNYHTLRRAFASVWERFFGKDRMVRSTVFASPPGKAAPESIYSRTLSFVAPVDGIAIKLLLRDAATADELDAAAAAFLALVGRVHRGERDEFIERQLELAPPRWGSILLVYDPQIKLLRVFDSKTGMLTPLDAPPTQRHPSMTTSAGVPLTRAAMRQLLGAVLRTDSDFDAFCLDHFETTYARFSAGMDRIAKTNLILQTQEPEAILARLRDHAPDVVAKHWRR